MPRRSSKAPKREGTPHDFTVIARRVVEQAIGEAEVRQVFRSSKVGVIAGSYVTQGRAERNAKVRLLREGSIIHEGELDSLHRRISDLRDPRVTVVRHEGDPTAARAEHSPPNDQSFPGSIFACYV